MKTASHEAYKDLMLTSGLRMMKEWDNSRKAMRIELNNKIPSFCEPITMGYGSSTERSVVFPYPSVLSV